MIDGSQMYDLLLVGAGPAGLEAALQAKKAGINALLIDREEAGFIIDSTMGGKRFYHAYGENIEPPSGLLDFPDRKIGSELVALWRKQAESLPYFSHVIFKSIKPDVASGGYTFVSDKGDINAQKMILATGMFAKPRKLGVLGEEGNGNIAYEFDYDSFVTDKKILVVGGGNSAVETALELSLDNEVMLIVRKPQLAKSVTERNRAELEREINKGGMRVFYNSTVAEFNGQEVTMKLGDNIEKRSFDKVYITIGFERPSDWLTSLGLELNAEGLPKLSENLETSRKGIFVTGALTGNDSIIGSANQSIAIVKDLCSNI